MSKKNIVRIIAALILVVGAVGILLAQIITPKEAKANVEQKAGYSTISSVAGCIFMINSSFVDKATAVTQISEGVNFTRNDFYSYKNGTDQYMLFQLDGVVVAVEKDTSFNFENSKPKENALKDASIMGIWFGTDRDGLKYGKSGNRTESTVTAQVVITNDLYNDFIGKLVTLNNGSEEWSMFVGVPGDRYKKLSKESKDGIEEIINTFALSDNTGEFKEPEYAVVISGNSAEPVEMLSVSEDEVVTQDSNAVTTEITTASENEVLEAVSDNAAESVLENSAEQDAETEQENTTEPTEETTEEPGNSKDTVSASQEKEDSKNDTDNDSKEDEPVAEDEPSPDEQLSTADTEETGETVSDNEAEEPKEPASEPAPEQDTGDGPHFGDGSSSVPGQVTFKSVLKTNLDDNKAYSSSIYSMLVEKQSGIYDSKACEGMSTERLAVKLERVDGSKATKEAIETAAKAGAPMVTYRGAPAGCHWESAVLDINYADVTDRPYTDVRIVGADGEALKFRGVRYPTRTYDLAADRADGDWILGYRVYYAVPNGCTEYVLKIGDGDNINGWQSAYYYINRQ